MEVRSASIRSADVGRLHKIKTEADLNTKNKRVHDSPGGRLNPTFVSSLPGNPACPRQMSVAQSVSTHGAAQGREGDELFIQRALAGTRQPRVDECREKNNRAHLDAHFCSSVT